MHPARWMLDASSGRVSHPTLCSGQVLRSGHAFAYLSLSTLRKIAMYVLRISGLQGHAKPGKAPTKEESEREGFMSVLEEAVREVGAEKGLRLREGPPPG